MRETRWRVVEADGRAYPPNSDPLRSYEVAERRLAYYTKMTRAGGDDARLPKLPLSLEWCQVEAGPWNGVRGGLDLVSPPDPPIPPAASPDERLREEREALTIAVSLLDGALATLLYDPHLAKPGTARREQIEGYRRDARATVAAADREAPDEEAEDAVWDVITRMNEEPAPCSGPAKRQARWLWEQSERPRVWADANGDYPILVPFPMAEQAVHVARASVVHEIVADLRAESEITGVARLAADRLADYIEQRYGATDPDVTQEQPISPRSVLVAHPREGDVRFDAYPGRDLIGDVARFAAGGLGITVGSDHATLAVGGIILDADEPLPDMPRFDLVLIGGVV